MSNLDFRSTASSQKENVIPFEDFKTLVRSKVQEIFNFTSDEQKIPLSVFLENLDHGALHAWNVYNKAIAVVDSLEQTGECDSINRDLIFYMAIAHDSGRFHISEENPKKQLNCERHHNKCGVAQIRLGAKKLKIAGKTISDSNQINALCDYVQNHDFFNTRLDGSEYQEPASIEGQIVRLADRMSTDIKAEVERYWETGKRLGTPYFKNDISIQDRIDFSFPRIKEYIKSGKFDEFTFFLALISMSPQDFANPHLGKIYTEWAKTKGEAINTILQIGKDEGYSDLDVQKMQETLDNYVAHFNITW